eukprot:scaffold92914_cov27-Prasinocladus_malaysianus.AAC.1
MLERRWLRAPTTLPNEPARDLLVNGSNGPLEELLTPLLDHSSCMGSMASALSPISTHAAGESSAKVTLLRLEVMIATAPLSADHMDWRRLTACMDPDSMRCRQGQRKQHPH